MESTSADLARRVGEIRREVFGEYGTPILAEAIGIPARTWANFESGVTLPAPVVLGLIEVTGVSPRWLYTGEGEKFSAAAVGQGVSPSDHSSSRS
jgi:hypothetical protein